MFPKFLRTIGIKKKKRATKEERTVADLKAVLFSLAPTKSSSTNAHKSGRFEAFVRSASFRNSKKSSVNSEKDEKQIAEDVSEELQASSAWQIPEVCLMIFAQLKSKELCALMCVSSSFKKMAGDYTLWKALTTKQFIDPAFTKSFSALPANVPDWREYYLARQHFDFLTTATVHYHRRDNTPSVLNILRLLRPKNTNSFVTDDIVSQANVDCGFDGHLFGFVGVNLPWVAVDSKLVVYACYGTAEHGLQIGGFTIRPLPRLAFAPNKKLFILVDFDCLEARNRWLKEILDISKAQGRPPNLKLILLQYLNVEGNDAVDGELDGSEEDDEPHNDPDDFLRALVD